MGMNELGNPEEQFSSSEVKLSEAVPVHAVKAYADVET
jgi:hypothetical protein